MATDLELNSLSPNSVSYGSTGPVTFTATLTRNDTSAGVAGATVNFTVDGNPAGSGVTNSSGVATYTTYNPSALSLGGHNVQASFAAATISTVNYLASTSGTLPLDVGKATPVITWAKPGGHYLRNGAERHTAQFHGFSGRNIHLYPGGGNDAERGQRTDPSC